MSSFSYKQHLKTRLKLYAKLAKLTALFLAGALLTCSTLAAIAGLFFQLNYRNKIYPGVRLAGLDLSGQTPEQAAALLRSKFTTQTPPPKETALIFGDQNWRLETQKLDFHPDIQAMVEQAGAIGRSGGFFNAWGRRLEAVTLGVNLQPFYVWNYSYLEELLSQASAEIDKAPVEARFRFDNQTQRVVEFVPSQTGQSLDQKQFVRDLEMLLPRQIPEKLTLPVKVLYPQVKTSQANSLGVNQLLGQGESFFYGSSSNRMHNIELAASRINGVLAAPGQTFSFNDNLGPVEAYTGFKKELVIKNNELILEDGGGVCQVSTTLFRSLLNSGLPIVERREHSFRVGYYEQGGYKPGLDATVYPGAADLRFTNNTPGHILIQANFDKANRRLAFELYGSSDNRLVSVGQPVIVESLPAPEPIYKNDPNLPPGTEKILEKAIPGAKVYFNYQVEKNQEIQISEKIWSNFHPKAALILRGAN